MAWGRKPSTSTISCRDSPTSDSSRAHTVVVHTKLSSFGHVRSGAGAVIEALQDAVTRQGTVVMPTYSGELIFFFELLALSAGVNGQGGSGRGVVFDGTATSLCSRLKEISEASGIRYPFATVDQMVKRVEGETRRILSRNGWTVDMEQGESAGGIVRLIRNADPLQEGEIEPWKMPAWTGAVPDAFWRREGVARSHQYSGSFAAWGRMADRVLEGHDNRPGQRMEDHPLYRMMEIGGKVLLLGVDHTANSTIHVAQWAAFRDSPVRLPESWREFLPSFQLVDGALDSTQAQEKGRVGTAEVRLADIQGLFRAVASLLADKVREDLAAE